MIKLLFTYICTYTYKLYALYHMDYACVCMYKYKGIVTLQVCLFYIKLRVFLSNFTFSSSILALKNPNNSLIKIMAILPENSSNLDLTISVPGFSSSPLSGKLYTRHIYTCFNMIKETTI